MSTARTRFTGVLNIVRFNWPYYVFAFFFLTVLLFVLLEVQSPFVWEMLGWVVWLLAFLNTLVSLLVSHYVYDLSGLYAFQWLNKIVLPGKGNFVNIHSGFDETSVPLQKHFPAADWKLMDFYDPKFNTEASIARARKKYPAPAETLVFNHKNWPLAAGSVDVIFCLFAAHEIRSMQEKVLFFREAQKVLKNKGEIIIAEHLRDVPDFFAFGPGFLHFFSRKHWLKTFAAVPELKVAGSFRVTPFVQVFILEKHD